jgi:hypothetical protein
MRHSPTVVLLLAFLATNMCAGQEKGSKPAADTKAAKIARALSAAPANIAAGAKVVDRDADGKEVTLREGNNGFTCFVGQCRCLAVGKRSRRSQAQTHKYRTRH